MPLPKFHVGGLTGKRGTRNALLCADPAVFQQPAPCFPFLLSLALYPQERLEQEKANLEKHNKWLVEELDRKADDMLASSRATAEQVLHLSSLLPPHPSLCRWKFCFGCQLMGCGAAGGGKGRAEIEQAQGISA